jgi:electron transfer flavoprotein-quinone oxidoreductase
MKVDYQVVVVGAGPAGCAAANYLARRGVEVALVEKAQVPGQRNVTGGVLYTDYLPGYSFGDAFPGFREEAPLERRIVSHEVVILSKPRRNNGKVSYRVGEIGEDSFLSRLGVAGFSEAGGEAYSVLRARLDKWMAAKVSENGGAVVTFTSVEDLYRENGRIRGVVTSSETITCNLVIDASGVTSKLVEKAGLRGPLGPDKVYHGVKHVFKLSAEKIEERFNLKPGEGRAIFYLGDVMKGVSGGGFLYTNKDTLSVGIVISLDSFIEQSVSRIGEISKPVDILEELESHPAVAALLEGAELVEYSAHNIPKGYKTWLKRPYTDGFLATGDSLGAFVKIGGLIDGMRRAVATGIMAAETYLKAAERGDFSAASLAAYESLLRPIYRDIKRSGLNSLLTESKFAYSLAPKLLLALSGKGVESNPATPPLMGGEDAIKKIQALTGLLEYDEDKEYSHIKVDLEKASRQLVKLWVPACPVNCYTIVLEKGVYASFKDLYRYNLEQLLARGVERGRAEREAVAETLRDISRARLNFDHVACVACGTCGVIGPPEIVLFSHEREGHGVKYRYG